MLGLPGARISQPRTQLVPLGHLGWHPRTACLFPSFDSDRNITLPTFARPAVRTHFEGVVAHRRFDVYSTSRASARQAPEL